MAAKRSYSSVFVGEMNFSVSLFGLQWAVGSLMFVWVTSRHRAVGLGYSQISRICFLVILTLAFILSGSQSAEFRWLTVFVFLGTLIPLVQAFQRRKVGLALQKQIAEKRTSRVAQMTGIERPPQGKAEGAEFDSRLDLIAPVVGLVGMFWLGLASADWLTTFRVLVGSLFLGAVTDAMALGHWYLVQPGLKRKYLQELVYWTLGLWGPLSLLYIVPTGMFSVFSGTIDDGYNGLLGWFWAACVVTTLALLVMTIVALRERFYSAVMAATGLLYLAILTAFGIDLVARALLA